MDRWYKQITASDAQRKTTGNQRGGITLVKGAFPIDSQTYFRYSLFGSAQWIPGKTITGEDREIAHITADTTILGSHYGLLDFEISYSSVREAEQDNYTCILHTAPIASSFKSHDMTGSWILIERTGSAGYTLYITAEKPA